MRIGPKRNFALESQQEEVKENDKIVTMVRKSEHGITNIDFILEPERFDELGRECRLTFDEYCDAINKVIEEEEADWPELRMKDQVNITRDAILEATVLKYVQQEYKMSPDQFTGRDLNYSKRYDEQGRFIGEALIITYMHIPTMEMKVNK